MEPQRPTSGQRYPKQDEDELIAWLVEMFRSHGIRFLQASGFTEATMRALLVGHRVYRAFQKDPEAWERAVQALTSEFGKVTVERFLSKLGATDRRPA